MLARMTTDVSERFFSERVCKPSSARSAAWLAVFFAVALIWGCSEQKDEPAADEDGEESQEAPDDGNEASGDEGDEDEGEAKTFPDDFPEGIPVPDDAEIVQDMSNTNGDDREIYLAFNANGDRTEMIEKYSEALDANFDVSNEEILEERELAAWDFTGGPWTFGRIKLTERRVGEGDMQILVILRTYEN